MLLHRIAATLAASLRPSSTPAFGPCNLARRPPDSLKIAIQWEHILLQVPPNGLVIYTGTVMTDDGKEKKLNIDFEPFKPINTSLYLCDNKFHTEALNELLESDSK